MHSELILDGLNDAQREAVTAPPGAVLVLAGAGSGKTRVLTRRLAWVIATENLTPDRILAVTFTNKAAAEMRGRVERLLEHPADTLWIGTFHGLSHRFLRRHAKDANLPDNFQILDSDDQLRLIKRILKAQGLDDKLFPPRQIAGIINKTKDEGRRLDEREPGHDQHARTVDNILAAYQDACERGGLVDFAELILRTMRLFNEHPEIAERYRSRFRHILVDEFQDTNTTQYLWVRAIAGEAIKPFIVGDDDQSIYGWRGAKVGNMERFQHDYAPVQVVRLEQNYRSTGHILNAANAVIAKNAERLGKNLWTAGETGMPIEIYAAGDDRDEALHAIARIERWIADGGSASDAAILYRSNAQSRIFEEILIARGIPYRVYGGQRFFDRAEIKDALAYLRLVNNRDDDTAFDRIVNTPPRGIGATTLQKLRVHARARRQSLWRSCIDLAGDDGELNGRARNALANFMHLIESLDDATREHDLSEAIETLITQSGLVDYHGREGGELGTARVENLEELVNAASEFTPEPDLTPVESFLAQAALEAGEAQADEWKSFVRLMTLHSAKGLEFPLVIIAGMEEGLFPHQKSVDAPGRLEEERRLFYVGMTRARKQLVLSWAELRRLHGQTIYSRPSRFLAELPEDTYEEVGPRRMTRSGADEDGAADVQLGRRVRHQSFGEGVILDSEGDGPRLRLKVAFEHGGTKWLLASVARLDVLD